MTMRTPQDKYDEVIPNLVALAQDGDEGAKSELLQRATQLVYARILRSIKGFAGADDVAQDALLAVLSGLRGLRDPKAFLAWLRRITDNVVADHLAEHRRGTAKPEGASLVATIGGQGSDDAAIRAEEQEMVRTALAGLAPKKRLAIELFYFHDLTCREVADFLRISHDAARTAVSRARNELRRKVMTHKAEAREKTEQSWVMYVSGDSNFRGGLFDRASDTDRLYRALYPAGDEAAVTPAGLSRQSTKQQLSLLRDMGLIVREDDRWRCTMPLAGEIDREIIHAWAEPIAEVLIRRLESIYHDLASLSQTVDGELAKSTVTTIGLMEAARRPFAALEEQMKPTAPDRGRFGRFRISVFTCKVPACTSFIGGYGTGEFESGGTRKHTYYFWPSRTRRPGIEALDNAFPSSQPGVGISHLILDKVGPVIDSDLTPPAKSRIAEELGIPANRREAFWTRLADLHAIGEREGRTRVIVPRLHYDPWQAYLASLDRIGAEMEDVVANAADDLRKRALHCSFAGCNFSDSVLAFLMYLEGLVKEAISERGWVNLPEEADFSWGALIVA